MRAVVVGLVDIHVQRQIPVRDLLLDRCVDVTSDEVAEGPEGDQERDARVVLITLSAVDVRRRASAHSRSSMRR